MIYDGHSYTFPDQRGNGGWTDRNAFHRHLERAMIGHHMPLVRASDRTEADASVIADLSRGSSFDALKDADFRPAGYGRFEWTVDGETYFKQVMPPSIVDMSFSAESLVAEMDYAGVDMSLIHRTPYLVAGNDFIADCVNRFPDRLQGLAYVEEWLVQSEPDASIRKLDRAISELGLHGIQWLPVNLRMYGQSEPWDGGGFRPFWDAVASMGIPVFFSLGSTALPNVEGYLEGLRTVRRWMERYPDVTVVMTHGLAWRSFMKEDRIELPEEVFENAPLDNPNLYLQLLFAVLCGGQYDYPMPQMHGVLEQVVERMGADRLIWGTDIPMVMRHYTYRQSLDSVRLYCDFLSDDQKAQILGGTMVRMMGLEPSDRGAG